MITLSDKRIAVTGATGLVGSHLVAELLREGCSVLSLMRKETLPDRLYRTLDRLGVAYEASRLSSVRVAFNNPHELADALQGCDVVFHCAARVSFDRGEEADIIDCNTELAQHVANASLECGVKLLVYVSSIATLGEALPAHKAVSEACELSHWEGRSPYSISKIFAENAIRRAAAQGLPTVRINPAVILGEGDRYSSSTRMIGGLIRWGHWGYTCGVKGYVDVRDVARAMVLLAKCPAAVGSRFILSGGDLSFRALQEMVALAGGHKPARIRIGPRLLRGVTAMLRRMAALLGREFPLSEHLVNNLLEKTYYDGTLVCRTVDFRYTSLEETIERVVAHYVTDQRGKS